VADTLRSFDEICSGKADDLPEQAFLYVGDIESVRARAKEMTK
jgi:F-type H+-transporting ATPase subunit beta